MYKILFVDDEQIVRDGVEHTIEWSSLGFEFVGAYENGADAAAAVDEHHPDVVITDICMPFRDGLELTERVAEQYPQTKVILLSGFDEFEYAQRAVRLGAYDYVLKPITATELRSLLTRVRADLDAEARRAEQLTAISRTLARARESRLAGLTERAINEASTDLRRNIAAELQDAGVRLPPGPGVALVAYFHGGRSVDCTAALAVVGQSTASTFLDYAHRTVSIISAKTIKEALPLARKAARSIISRTNGAASTVTVGVGRPFGDSAGVAESYRDAVCSLNYRFIAGLGRSIEHDEVPEQACHLTGYSRPEETEWSPQFGSAVAELARAIRTCDASECVADVDLVVAEMRRTFSSRGECTLQVHSILVHVNELRRELGQPPISVDAFSKLETLDDVGRLLHEICSATVETQVERRETYGTGKTREALAFIERNYASTLLSLTSLCDSIGISPSYFSTVFKSHTGQTFVEHLTELRVDHAKQLLKTTDLKIYEIAEQVGYQDQHYFCTIFKKATGRSPTEFRRETAPTES